MGSDPTGSGDSSNTITVDVIKAKKKVNVWASTVIGFIKTDEYPVSFSFTNFENLLNRPEMLEHKGVIKKIVLNAHGDYGGVLQVGAAEMGSFPLCMDKKKSESTDYFPIVPEKLTPQTISLYKCSFQRLAEYLTTNAEVVFASCITGQNYNGSAFLKTVSQWLPGRKVVAFTTILSSGIYSNKAGEVWDTGARNEVEKQIIITEFERSGRKKGGMKLMSIHSDTAKWAKNGKIIKNASVDFLTKSDSIEIPVRSTKPVPKKNQEAYSSICAEWSDREWTIVNLQINLARHPNDSWTNTIQKKLDEELGAWRGRKRELEAEYSKKIGLSVSFPDFRYNSKDIHHLNALREVIQPYKDKKGYPCNPQAVSILYKKMATSLKKKRS